MSTSAQLANAVQGARAIAAQGDKRGALVLLDKAVDDAAARAGSDDPDVLTATVQLARYHAEIGELNDARRVLEEGLAAGYQRLGDGHPAMLGLSFELARVADALGNVFEAKRRYNLVVTHGPQALGAGHPSVRAAREYLGLPDPEGDVHVPPPPVTFDPLTPLSPRPPVDEGPIFRPAPREEERHPPAAAYAEPAYAEPDPVVEDYDDEDDYQPAPWQRAASGLAERTGQPPASAPPWPAERPSGPWADQQPPTSWSDRPPPASWADQPVSGPPRFDRPVSSPPGPVPVGPRPVADATRRRSPMIAVLVIIIVAVIGGGIAAAVAFISAGGDDPGAEPAGTVAAPASGPPSPPPSPTAAAPGNARAPGNLQLKDDKTSVTLTWTDPTKGASPFIVAGGTEGAMRQLQGLPAGTTKYTINGLNAKLEYCFTVAAVYSTSDVQLSDLVCTKRK
ncbi:hypothetical protein [Dactylosporangium sp. NPDC051541]|uniref:hypothetical protein n=1 Tax=Dactylosporangium sp. NPDC051541 TaxID=3363977 RepID=UPI0037AA2E3D